MNSKQFAAVCVGVACACFGWRGAGARHHRCGRDLSRTPFTPNGPKPTRPRSGIGLNYQSIGSGGGIKQIQNKTVDFGASDMPLKPEDLDKDGLLQFPTVIGGDVPVVNLEGVKPGELKLTGPRAG